MWIPKFRLVVLQFFRLLQILGIVIKHSINELLAKNYFIKKINKKRKRVNNLQERIRITIEELGPTFIKFGQIIADRPDLASEKLRLELKKLQSAAVPMENETAINLIENELGGSVDIVFSNFNKEALASASIGQVYSAELKTGESVVVKIQRPNIKTKIQLDLYLLKYFAIRIVKAYPELAAMNIVNVVDKFGETLLSELNYLNEASNILRFKEMFKNDNRVYIPKVYMEYTTPRLLIMEKIEGVPPDEIHRFSEVGADRKIIAANGADIIVQMILKHGFFHADPHPGNIFVMKNNVIAFIDFGMVGVLKPAHLNFLAGFILGFARKDVKTITKSLLTLGELKFFEQEEELEFEIEQLLKKYGTLPFNNIDISLVLQNSVEIILKYNIIVPSSIYFLFKALATIQKFANNLDPDLSLPEIIEPHAKDLIKKKYSPSEFANAIYNTLGNYVSLLRDFPLEVNEILYKVKQGKLIHEIKFHDKKGLGKNIYSFARLTGAAFLIGAMFIGSTMLLIYDHEPALARVVFAISAILGTFMLLRFLFKSNKY